METKIQVPRPETCERCAGSGSEPGTQRETCETCRGRGEIRMSQGFLTVARPCPKCHGEGQVNKHPCKGCRGEGRQRAERTLQVKIPAGIEDGMQLRLTGEGGGGVQGGPAGDLYVLVRIAEHELFVRDGADLYCDIPVTFPQLALGDEVEVPVLDGTETLTIAAGHPAQRGRAPARSGDAAPARAAPGRRLLPAAPGVPRQLNARQREALRGLRRGGQERARPSLAVVPRADEEAAGLMSAAPSSGS